MPHCIVYTLQHDLSSETLKWTSSPKSITMWAIHTTCKAENKLQIGYCELKKTGRKEQMILSVFDGFSNIPAVPQVRNQFFKLKATSYSYIPFRRVAKRAVNVVHGANYRAVYGNWKRRLPGKRLGMNIRVFIKWLWHRAAVIKWELDEGQPIPLCYPFGI